MYLMENNKYFKTIFDFLFRISLSLLIGASFGGFVLVFMIDIIWMKIFCGVIAFLLMSLIPNVE